MIYLTLDTKQDFDNRADYGVERKFHHMERVTGSKKELAEDRPRWYNGIEHEPEVWILSDECHELLMLHQAKYVISWVQTGIQRVNSIELPDMAWMIGIDDPKAAVLFKLTFL